MMHEENALFGPHIVLYIADFAFAIYKVMCILIGMTIQNLNLSTFSYIYYEIEEILFVGNVYTNCVYYLAIK